MLTCDEALRFLQERCSGSHDPVRVYWLPLSESREKTAGILRATKFSVPVVAIVLRQALFDNPNSVLNDLVHLLAENKRTILASIGAAEPPASSCILALLTKTELRIPQIGSPVTLPEWFPFGPGVTLEITIEDVTWTASALLNSESFRSSEISEALVDLEDALVPRLAAVAIRSHNRSNSLLQLFRLADKSAAAASYHDMLQEARSARAALSSASGFRPSLRQQRFIVSRITAVGLNTPGAQIDSVARALSDAIHLNDEIQIPYESYLSVVQRPQPFTKGALRLARNLVNTVAGASQLITAAAHADEYSAYPLLMLRATSLDLRRSLSGCREVLLSLPQ